MSRIQMPRTPYPEILDPEILDPEILEPETLGPAAAEPGNRRQWPRYALLERESFTVTADGRPGTDGATCAIEDISLGGARLRMAGSVPHNLEIRIEHPRLGHAYARRCWKAKDRLGVAFDHSGPSLAFIAGCVAEGVEIAAPAPPE